MAVSDAQPVATVTPSDSILHAFRFLEDVGSQIEALRKELKRQVQEPTLLNPLRLTVGKARDDGAIDESGWVWRSVMDSFELYARGTKPLVYAGFQISLAPSRGEADANFFPNLAVLIAGLRTGSDWEQWECEEFELDSALLDGDNESEGDPWKAAGENRWVPRNNGPAVAFVVRLVELRDRNDVEKKVMRPFVDEIGKILTLLKQPGG